MPVARHNDRDAAARLPLVVVFDLNGFMLDASLLEIGKITTMSNRTTHLGRRVPFSG
jgi:hypothetical protein